MVRELKCALRKQSQGTVTCKVSRFLFKQHSTPHTETGKTPAELMLGRSFRSALSSMQPDANDAGCTRQPRSTFQRGDPVYVRNFSRGPKWVSAHVVRCLGHVMYEVRTADGSIHRRHRGHMRSAWKTTPADITDPQFMFPATPAIRPAATGPTSTVPETAQACRRSTRARRPYAPLWHRLLGGRDVITA